MRAEVGEGVAEFTAEHGRPPGLATVLVGEDPGSAIYVASKQKATAEVGMRGFDHRLRGRRHARAGRRPHRSS